MYSFFHGASIAAFCIRTALYGSDWRLACLLAMNSKLSASLLHCGIYTGRRVLYVFVGDAPWAVAGNEVGAMVVWAA